VVPNFLERTPAARFNKEKQLMIFSRIRRFILSEDGPTAVEYAVMVGLIVVALAAAVPLLTSSISSSFTSVSSTVGS
jgi:pilus assembly protein Flp/PilA